MFVCRYMNPNMEDIEGEVTLTKKGSQPSDSEQCTTATDPKPCAEACVTAEEAGLSPDLAPRQNFCKIEMSDGSQEWAICSDSDACSIAGATEVQV